MSHLFVPSSCQLSGDTFVSTCAWGKIDQIVALACTTVDESDKETNQVLFSTNEGEIIPKAVITHHVEATVFDWHPLERILAIGWADGMVCSWTIDTRNRPTSSFSNSSQHSSAIAVLKWNPMGKRLVTGDQKGTVCVWAVDSRGSLNPIRQYKRKGEISTLIFCLMPLRAMHEFHAKGAIAPANDAAGNVPAVAPAKVETAAAVKVSYSPSFFFGTDKGSIVYADDLGHCTDVQQLTSPVDVMMFFEEKSRLIIITRSFLLSQYHVADDGKVTRVSQVKLSVPPDILEKGIKSIVWAGPGLLAAATEEKIVRLFDLATDETYNLSLAGALGDIVDKKDKVTCVSFSAFDRYLAVGTQAGLVAIWKYMGVSRDLASGAKASASTSSAIVPSTAADWEIIFRYNLKSCILQLCWHGGHGTVAAVTHEDGTFILNESVLHSAMAGDVTVVQVSSVEVSVHIALSEPILINTKIQIKSLAVGRSSFAVSSGKVVKIYRVDLQFQKCEALPTVNTNSTAMAIADADADSKYLSEEAWFVAEANVVKINNFHGTQKGLISFSEAEGMPEFLDINGRYLAIVSNKGYIKIIDVFNPTKPKQQGSAGQFFNPKSAVNSDDMKIRQMRVNCSGTRVAILADTIEGAMKVFHPDSKLYIYDRNKGAIMTCDFITWKRSPISVFWDDTDDRMICCEALRNRQDAVDLNKASKVPSSDGASGDGASSAASSPVDVEVESEVEVFIFFATSEHGILMQDSFPRKHPNGAMISLSVPRFYFRSAVSVKRQTDDDNDGMNGNAGQNGSNNNAVKIYSRVMRDFVGMDDVSENAKYALLDFSYNLTLGKLDDAYRAVKAIDSPGIWENMAQMCVKTKRLDVAEVCLGNMGHVRGAAAVREAKKECENDVGGSMDMAVGVLAIQLGLLDDAARIFREAGRYDMLNRLYQAAGLWDKAVNTAQSQDRIHLNTTHYQHFQLSNNSRTEVPRMLFHLGRVEELSEYVMKSDDSSLLKWWAAYLESIERFDKAKKFYNKAEDYLSLVRICCFQGDLQKAAEIVQESGDRASAYHFARQMENQGEFQEAITFYAMSGCYNHSIRLAKAFGLDNELMRYAVKSTPSLMIECALYFENKNEYDKAVQLYHKGGDIPRALDLCFRIGEEEDRINSNKTKKNVTTQKAGVMFDMLNTIAQDLGAESSPQTLARCAEFLVQHKQFEKAIELYMMAKRFHSAVEMCLQHKVNITDEMVEKLTPPETVDASERKEVLQDLAKALKKQGSFTLASKKYTQAGDRVRAIKCLVRSGDTKAVIQFASISRNQEIYTLAANYLQQMNWRESVDIMKAIITFYTKAKAFVQLAGFYDGCAQVEIDEYRDYEKAIGALKEGLKYLNKETSPNNQIRDMLNSFEKRINMIEKYVQARKLAKKDPAAMVAMCNELLEDPMLEEAIRAGDCLGMLVEFFYANRQMEEAYKYLREMEERRIQLHPYLDAEIIDAVYRAVGAKAGGAGGGARKTANTAKGKGGKDLDEDIEDDEEVEDDEGPSRRKGKQSEEDDEIDEDIEEDDDRIPSKAATSRPRAQQFPTNKYYKGDDTTATPSAPGPGRRK